MDVSEILSRFSGVKVTTTGNWICRCPAHEDRTPSVTIRELEDGRILVHCFAGCGAADVVAAAGLSLSDLFPERLGEFRPVRAPFTSWDALLALKGEAAIVAISASDVAEGKKISSADADRVAKAAGRIADALEYINARG